MKYDEFAFFNQQLAGMLRSGIPLEGALRQLCGTMKRGKLRAEFEHIERKLADGHSLETVIASANLPPLYVQMIRVGIRGNDLPGVLTLVADYYHRMNSLWTRLKGLMLYPAIVLFVAVGLSIFLALGSFGLTHSYADMFEGFGLPMNGWQRFIDGRIEFIILLPTILLCLVAVGGVFLVSNVRIRKQWRWRISGFKEANIANFAATLALMLKQGTHLNEALLLMRELEGRSPLADELSRWQQLLASGRGKISDLSQGSKVLPPLFFWMLASEGENWAAGFSRAAELYHARAVNKADMLLFAALPVAVLILGLFMVGQIFPLVIHTLSSMTNLLDGGF